MEMTVASAGAHSTASVASNVEVAGGSGGRLECNLVDVFAHRKIERQAPDLRNDASNMIERHSAPDPAGVHDVDPVHQALARGRAVIFETEGYGIAAQF